MCKFPLARPHEGSDLSRRGRRQGPRGSQAVGRGGNRRADQSHARRGVWLRPPHPSWPHAHEPGHDSGPRVRRRGRRGRSRGEAIQARRPSRVELLHLVWPLRAVSQRLVQPVRQQRHVRAWRVLRRAGRRPGGVRGGAERRPHHGGDPGRDAGRPGDLRRRHPRDRVLRSRAGGDQTRRRGGSGRCRTGGAHGDDVRPALRTREDICHRHGRCAVGDRARARRHSDQRQ